MNEQNLTISEAFAEAFIRRANQRNFEDTNGQETDPLDLVFHPPYEITLSNGYPRFSPYLCLADVDGRTYVQVRAVMTSPTELVLDELFSAIPYDESIPAADMVDRAIECWYSTL